MKELFEEFFDYWGLKRKYNTLELENKNLKEILTSDMYKSLMNKLNESDEKERLKAENRNLRAKNKKLKEELKKGGGLK